MSLLTDDKVDTDIRRCLLQDFAAFVDCEEIANMISNNLNVNGVHMFEHELHLPILN